MLVYRGLTTDQESRPASHNAPMKDEDGAEEALTDVSARISDHLPLDLDNLRRLFQPLGEPPPGDWLDIHDEPGQTFEEYLLSDPTTSHSLRRIIYVQPLGPFTPSQRAVVDATADFLSRYFQLPLRVSNDWPESLVPEDARRRHPDWGVEQILTDFVLYDLLKPRLPDDAAAYLALTAIDLWPGEGWNFVFGEASIEDRVGVWSIHRYGDPSGGEGAFRLCLLRTLKTATHEAGHLFSMDHCTAYACNMGGSESLAESDRGPLALCPECLAKLCWATQCDPIARYRQLIDFCRTYGLTAEQSFYEHCLQTLVGAPSEP